MTNKLRQIRTTNTTKVIDVLRERGGRTVRDIAGDTQLSRATVSKILSSLQAQAIVVDRGMGSSTPEGGKPPKLYSFDPAARFLIGMHLFHNDIVAGIVDLNLRVVGKTTHPISRDRGHDRLVEGIHDTVGELLRSAAVEEGRVLGMGIGTHGVTDPARGAILHSPHHPAWGRDFELRERVLDRIGHRLPVYIDNSVRFRTIAERSVGALQRVTDGVVIHSSEMGLIAGVLLDGRIRRGRQNLSGSIGHMTLNSRDEEQCDCGGRGCFEMQVKPARLVKRVSELSADYPQSTLAGHGAEELTIGAIFAAANDGDALAREVVREAAHWFAIGIHNVILTLDPEMVVMQGVYADAGSYFESSLSEQLDRVSLIMSPSRARIVYSSLGDDAALLGAASYALSQQFA